jgi:parallel beta-helix repeat protein
MGNTITDDIEYGIHVESSVGNIVYDNLIANSGVAGIYFDGGNDNRIYHNTFIDNSDQVRISASFNFWHDGYPSGGNYWSDYTGADLYNGPFQNETGCDGIGDTPYVIDENNQDNYPLMKPYPDATPPIVTIVSPENKAYTTPSIPLTFTIDECTCWIGYSVDGELNVTSVGNTTLTSLLDGSHHVVVYANDTVGNMGASNTIYFTVDTTPPNITEISQIPLSNNVLPEDQTT